jgi:hypothetical protein
MAGRFHKRSAALLTAFVALATTFVARADPAEKSKTTGVTSGADPNHPLHWNDVEHPGFDPNSKKPPEKKRLRLKPPIPVPPVPLVPVPNVEPPDEFEALPNTPRSDLPKAGKRAAEDYVTRHLKELHLERPERPIGIHAPERIDDDAERVSQMIQSKMGQFHVQRGMIDPYFSEVRKQFDKQWNPEPAVELKEGLEGYALLKARQIQDQFRTWNRFFSGHHESTEFEQDAPERSSLDIEPDPGNPASMMTHFGNPPGMDSVTSSALVAINWDRDGNLTHIELVRPSDDPAMDNELLNELYGGKLVPPKPPSSGFGIHDTIRTVWEFRLTVSIAPPAPALSGSFDEAALFDHTLDDGVDVMLPLQRKISKHIELLSVE